MSAGGQIKTMRTVRYCPNCFAYKHPLWRAVRGWLAWNLVCRWWPPLSIPPFLAIAGDWIYDTRGCGCGVPLATGQSEVADERAF
jgi:hypothetical protein